ncbi:MAG: hypothetical protein AAGC55_21720 [Myxococcota bacterium]
MQLTAGAILWVTSCVAALFGMWIPLALMAGAGGLLLLQFAGPDLWDKLRRRLLSDSAVAG